MKIIKYRKLSKGRYKLFLDDDNTLTLYEDVIFKYNLLLSKEILEKDLVAISDYNQECDVYYVALDSITARMKSKFLLRQTLIRKEYPIELIDKAIDKLEKQGYLDDRIFARSYINNQMITTNKGPYKIKKELLEKKVSETFINEEIKTFTEAEQTERINKLIEKAIKLNRTKGGIVLKQKIYNDLRNLGYDLDIVNRIIADYTFNNDKDIAKREYEKLYRKYIKKYKGYELKQIVNQKLYMKGLKYEEE